jgi:hypothetical protein
MKFFISHKKEDVDVVKRIHLLLKIKGIESYLDLVDGNISGDGKKLTDHIRANLNDCTDIIVVMSEMTRYSQWVPFEVGIATQIELPIATFLQAEVQLPEFLSFWPRLKTPSDIDKYVEARKFASAKMNSLYENKQFESRNRTEIDLFYKQLKSQL